MQCRTDLALEAHEVCPDCRGVSFEQEQQGDTTVTRIRVENSEGERAIGKPIGNYVTIGLPPLTNNAFLPEREYELISDELSAMLPEEGMVMVVGLGNELITPDALGPRTIRLVPATRHITKELQRTTGFTGLRSTAVLRSGVLGQTGIESVELLTAICARIRPAAVIVIDAMASRRLERLGRTVQLCDGGIAPGAGVGNDRPAIDKKVLGIPVISIGVPTVVDAETLARDLTSDDVDLSPEGRSMIITPREIDLLIDRASRLLALAINNAVHPLIDPAELMATC